MAEECRKIMREHLTKGLILCASYDLQRELYALLADEFRDRLIIHTNEKGAPAGAIEAHKRRKTEPTVLIGVEMHEGLDLKDDLARFLIIPKVLYRARNGWANGGTFLILDTVTVTLQLVRYKRVVVWFVARTITRTYTFWTGASGI